MKPPPPMLPAFGKVTASAKPTATAASTALPPRASTSRPISVARLSWLATIPCGAVATCAAATPELSRMKRFCAASGVAARMRNAKAASTATTARTGFGPRDAHVGRAHVSAMNAVEHSRQGHEKRQGLIRLPITSQTTPPKHVADRWERTRDSAIAGPSRDGTAEPVTPTVPKNTHPRSRSEPPATNSRSPAIREPGHDRPNWGAYRSLRRPGSTY